jgi:hypothetical protein
MMKFYEDEFFFQVPKEQEKGVFDLDSSISEKEPELQGIRVRLANNPIVYNLKKLMELAGKELTPELQLQFQTNDIYLITHAIGVIRISGKTKVVELQYNAEIINIENAKTIDLFPKTRFVDRFKIESGLSGSVKAAGNFSAEIPEELKNSLSGTNLTLGGDMELELSTNTKFVGKVNYSIQLPVVQSSGVASNHCTWILKPDENPLLGDQLLVQTVSVPKGTDTLIYSIKGLVKVSKGWIHQIEQKETTTQNIYVKLN